MEFVRPPRLPVPTVATGDVVVEAPPQLPKQAPVNPLARLLPVAMLVAMLGMLAVYFTSGTASARNPMVMFFPVMMLTSILGTLAYGARGTNRNGEVNQDRRGYLRYLDRLDSAIEGTTDDQRLAMAWRHPEPESLWTVVGSQRMWERTPGDVDFGEVRVGLGDQPLCTPLALPDAGQAEESDPVTVGSVRRLAHQRSVVTDLPIVLALLSHPVVVVDGELNVVRALLRAVACQLAVWHGPDHLAVAVVASTCSSAEWDWLKWLPHHQHPDAADAVGSARLVYRDLGQAVSFAELTARHTVVIVDADIDIETFDAADGVTAIAVAVARGGSSAGVTVRTADGEGVIARPDGLTSRQAVTCARRLARYRVVGEGNARPGPRDWLALMGIRDPRHIGPEGSWTAGGGRRILPVPIGVAEDGTTVQLDINESARNGMGPHGLCVGATGSGKSEFLRTLALGMIARHPPEVLNLVLIDFKGGATFLGLDKARHVAAVITNLASEAHLVSRMNDAITGEMNRRQELLRSAGTFANVAEYGRARSQGADLPPLPSLFILVDEFSELLSQHPEFAELFLAIGRLGRSLGMHLLLASQRLDEGRLRGLETHLSYRICLKTFSASESRAVLGTADAHHLPNTPGAAYLKTASGELTQFHTAFVSAPYEERLEAPASRATPMRPLLFTAAPVGSRRERVEAVDRTGAPTRTVLDAVLERVAGDGEPARRIWLPPLAASPTLDMLGADRRSILTASIGFVDNPYHQRRDELAVELDGAAGNVAIVGAPRSGKSTALRTLLLALAATHDPADVAFYCLDFGGGALSTLREAPHVGSVAGRRDVDLCRRTVGVVEAVIRSREVQFRRLGIDSIAEYRRRRAAGAVTDDPYGDVFLVVDGWVTLRQEFDGLEPPITTIAAQGLSYGVHVVVTAARWAELRPALKDQIATRIELRLGDPADSEMDRKRARELSGRPPGHGLTAAGREMAIALPRWDGKATADGLAEVIAANVQRLNQRWEGREAPPVELLPSQLQHSDLVRRSTDRASVLIGLRERDLMPVAVDFAEQQHLVVLGESGCGKTAALRLLCGEITRCRTADEAQLEIVDFRRTLLGVVESEHLSGYAMSPVALSSRMPLIVDRLQTRMPDENVTQQQLRTRSWWSGPEIYVVVDDYDLASGSTGNPLAPLADLLPHAKDLGLHLIVARRSGGAARAMFDPVLARLRELGAMGLMMSASPDEGVLLGSVRPTALPPGRGALIRRAEPDQLIQVAWTDPP
jgi:S-DNA-T family DNA segregation ATPase FtsK/SpoIIIE